MKVKIENLGKLKKIEYEVGRLTILCGHNNTGKTYAMYALYGLLSYAQGSEDQILGGGNKILREKALIKKVTSVYKDLNLSCFEQGDDYYHISTKELFSLPKLEEVWSIIVTHFSETDLLETVGIKYKTKIKPKLMIERDQDLQLSLNKILKSLESVPESCEHEPYKFEQNRFYIHKDFDIATGVSNLSIMLAKVLYIVVIPCNVVHISSVERSGISMFSDELTISKNKFVAKLLDNEKVTAEDIRKITMNMKYATPVKDNIEFMGYRYRQQTEQESFIVKKHPEIIDLFTQLANGKYMVDEYGIIRHYPTKSKKSLTLSESSSAIRALSDLSFYLQHLAQLGDLLMIDEPELNLHPDNQRLMARLIAMLVNVGIKVMMTTHSDYLVREFNTLIMMQNQHNKYPEKTNRLMKKYGYDNLALLTADQCRASFVKNNAYGNAEFTKIYIDPFYGIITENFDRTIQNMQDIQDDLCFIK
jgi:ABC-type multidrug transport system ATPase subunit